MDLRQLEQFVAVYEEGSFSRAARRAHCTQPGLSVQIRNLETELGVALFTRDRRGVTPTVAGKRLYARGLSILNAVADTTTSLRALAGDVTGSITVGAVPSVARSALPAALSRYTERYPNVEVRLDEAYSGTLTERVVGGEFDFAIVTSPMRLEGLERSLLAAHEMTLVSGPGSGFTPFEKVCIAELAPLHLVVPTTRHAARTVIDGHLSRSDTVPAAMIESDGLNTTLEYVRRSGWSTITPVASVIGSIEDGTFVVNPIVRPRAAFDYYLVHQARRPLTPAAERFVEMLRDELADIMRRWRSLAKANTGDGADAT